MSGFERLLASRTKYMDASAIREILKVVGQPGMISMAGGLPAASSFPIDLFPHLVETALKKYGAKALQYDLTEGFMPFREQLVELLAGRGIKTDSNQVIVSSGSQGALDGLGKVLLSEGDVVAVEAPTYLGALQSFSPYAPTYAQIQTDDHGAIPESLDEVLSANDVKMVYLVPTFQNPTGRTLTLERRKQIAEIVQRRNVLLIEDDPYSALRFRGDTVPPIQTLAPDHTVYISTMSKIMSPGLRLGFVVAPEPIRHWLILAKQGTDLHTSTFTQAIAAEYLSGDYLAAQIPKIIDIYRPRQEALLRSMEEDFPADFSWTHPDGGMFVWVTAPTGFDVGALYDLCIERGAAFVPGRFFYTQPGAGVDTMRLSYVTNDEGTLSKGIAIIGEAIEELTG